MAIRGDGRAIIPVALTKFASLAAVPMAWRIDRRGVLLGGLAAVAIAAVSFALEPGLWWAYFEFLPKVPRMDTAPYNIGAGIPLMLRLSAGSMTGATIPLWQVGASLGLLALTAFVTLKVSSKVFRLGLLLYGKTPTLPEIMKLVRQK